MSEVEVVGDEFNVPIALSAFRDKMLKLNETRRLKQRPCKQAQHAKLYILTYSRIRKKEPLISLGFHQGKPSTSACAVPQR